MRKKVSAIKAFAFVWISLFMFAGCEEEVPERFVKPDWLKGDNIITLEEKGNYTNFLALMDKAEYRVSIENQLFTIFAPDDDAFKAYLQQRGLDSIGELTKQQAEELFGLHILINPRSREQLLYEYGWGQLETPEGEYGSLFLRKETYSEPAEYKEIIKYNTEHKGDTLIIFSQKTLLPFFTAEYFENYYGDPKGSDYTFMYPGSSWSGTQWHDAMVIDEPEGTSSGFIYYIDRVVAPPPTIDVYLKENPDKYSLFYDIAQRFAKYDDAGLNEKAERIYNKGYNNISNFANERGPGSQTEETWLFMFSAFVPTNDVLQDYLDNTILQSYSSMDSVPEPYWVYLLQSHLSDILQIPSKISSSFKNFYGNNIDIDINTDIEETFMCNNGVVYTMNKVLEPFVFSSVTGPILYETEYTTFLYILDNTLLLNSLANIEKQYTLLAPTNDDLLEAGVRSTSTMDGIVIQKQGSDGVFFDYDKIEDQISYIQDYYSTTVVDNFDGEGFLKMVSGNHIYYNNGKLYSGGNMIDGDYAEISDIHKSDKNGNLFYLENPLKQPLNSAQTLAADDDFSSFFNLLYQAELLDSTSTTYEPNVMFPRVKFVEESEQWTVFAPSNQAIADAESAGLIPENIDSLKTFLQYHFVRDICVFDDGKKSGTYQTQFYYIEGEKQIYKEVNISNAVQNLQVQDVAGNTVSVLHSDANRLSQRTVIHKINTCLKPGE